MLFKKAFALHALIVPGLVAGCASVGPTDNPFVRELAWQRYVGGDDIDRTCRDQSQVAYRLVYNGVEDAQRRTYDLTGQPDGGAMLEVRVLGPAALNDPQNPISVRDPLAPWRGQQALYRLSAAEFRGLLAAVSATGFDAPAPQGLFLRGDGFYWAASACRDGKFHFHAWSAPSAEFDRMARPLLAALAPYDKTGVAVQEPREVPFPPYSNYFNTIRPDGQPRIPHRFQVSGNGLAYTQRTIN